jgi:hypothetical protein
VFHNCQFVGGYVFLMIRDSRVCNDLCFKFSYFPGLLIAHLSLVFLFLLFVGWSQSMYVGRGGNKCIGIADIVVLCRMEVLHDGLVSERSLHIVDIVP